MNLNILKIIYSVAISEYFFFLWNGYFSLSLLKCFRIFGGNIDMFVDIFLTFLHSLTINIIEV